MRPLIGIVAGMGPKSTGPFIDQVVSAFQERGAVCDNDFPPMIIYTLPTPFKVGEEMDHSLVKGMILETMQKLQSLGASILAMPCNTTHIYYADLQNELQIPLVNMIDATLGHIPKKAKKVAIMATRATVTSKLYQKGLEKMGFSYEEREEWQILFDDILKEIKANPSLTSSILKHWDNLLTSLKAANVDSFILGCTDFTILLKESKPPFYVVDSSECLAQEVVKRFTD